MDEKHQPPVMNPPRRKRCLSTTVAHVRRLLLLVVSFFVGYHLWSNSVAVPFLPQQASDILRSTHDDSAPNALVPLEAHIISKCPDTRDALRTLILPVMQQVHDKVDFRLSYIGKPTANGGVDCKHGPSECIGNIIELCARELYPDPKINLGFIMCLTKDYTHIPERTLIEDCALEHAIDFNKLNECAARDDTAHGLELLRNSVQRSADVCKRDG
ncbi:gamma interferon inducible lysosomal thiol reductase [Trichoderma arundinaceum]|uniref:Gamma interferon inducible lysosomal thiol reductase n=1 Tax=Trichoderma arundinaceum TaxID=490622 RepID=A0A395NMR6_TRIAR|nr:gamma interferon inducible lysosomal thiol reductase [Trichoderma arundinaceum]